MSELKIDRVYKCRYLAEPWNKPIPTDTLLTRMEVNDNSAVVTNNGYGYSDEILVVSMLNDKEGNVSSIALFDSVSKCGRPSKEMITEIRDYLNHYLEAHC